jgi:hypothetical protein
MSARSVSGLNGKLYPVETAIHHGYDPAHIFSKVRVDARNFHILRQQTSMPNAQWGWISFRQNASRFRPSFFVGRPSRSGQVQGRLVQAAFAWPQALRAWFSFTRTASSWCPLDHGRKSILAPA